MSDEFSHKNVNLVASIIFSVVLFIGLIGLYVNLFID
jgi:hypothetical protein